MSLRPQAPNCHNSDYKGREMAKDPKNGNEAADIFTEMLRMQGEAARQMMQTFAPQAADKVPDESAIDAMGQAMMEFQQTWLQFCLPENERPAPLLSSPSGWMEAMRQWTSAIPMLDPQAQRTFALDAGHQVDAVGLLFLSHRVRGRVGCSRRGTPGPKR